MPFYAPGPGAVQTAYVSYRSVNLTADLVLFWPNAFQSTDNVMAAYMNFPVVAGGGLTVTLPDARQVSVGQNFIISNSSGQQFFQLLDNAGGFLADIYNGTQAPQGANAFYFILEDNTTAAGIWRSIGFGSTTAAPVPSALAGPGLIADNGKLWTNAFTRIINAAPFTIDSGDFNGSTFLWTAGTGVLTLDPTVDPNIQTGFYFYINTYQASGQVTITPPAGKKIDNATTKIVNPKQSLMLILDVGGNWWSIGYSPANTNTFSVLNLAVNSGTVTLDAVQAGFNLIYITGVLTANCTVVFPNINSEWQVANATTGPHTLTIELSGFPGSDQVIAQGVSSIFYSVSGVFYPIPTSAAAITSVGVTSTDLTVGGSPITPLAPGPITLSLNTVGIAKGGTGQTTRSNALNALMPPMPNLGDLIYWDGAIWNTISIGTPGQKLTVSGGIPVWA